MNSLFVIRFGEIGTKGANRGVFERKLVDNVRYALERVGRFTVTRETGRVTARSLEEVSVDRALAELACVFGIAGVSVAREARLDFESICAACVDRMDHAIGETPTDGRSRLTFKVEARRANKAFPLPSLEIAKQVGAHLLDRFPSLGVDVHDPRIRIRVDVRERAAYVSDREMAGPGGIAVGSAGRVVLMLSGGIDSPVAGWMMMRRGVRLDAVYNHAPPFTSPRSEEKVLAIARVLSRWHVAPIRVHVVGFTEIQEAIVKNTDERLRVVLYRRFMSRIGEAIAGLNRALALVTGDSLGQVASQTLENLAVVSDAVKMSILRPLISMDKNDICAQAQRIGTYEHSIQPFPDCCSLFLPRHPKTKAKLSEVLRAEERLDVAGLVARAVEAAEVHQPSWDEVEVHRRGRPRADGGREPGPQ